MSAGKAWATLHGGGSLLEGTGGGGRTGPSGPLENASIAARYSRIQPRGTRSTAAVGPFQVAVTIDDTPQGHSVHGGAACTVMVNGKEIATARRFDLPPRPRLQLQTFAEPYKSAEAFAVVDDLSVSVSTDRTTRPESGR